MPESGEWFSPRTRPEMLTSDDPLVHDKYDAPLEHVEILPGPATLAARVVEPFRRVAAFVPELGRRIVRVEDEPSRWQLAGMWATGSAIVAGTGLAVAAVLGGAPPALTQQFDRLSVLPGLNESSGSDDQPAPAADKAATSQRGTSGSADGTRERTSASSSSSGTSSYGGYSGYSGIPGVPAGASFPDSVVVPGLPAGASSGSDSGTSSGTGSGSGSGTVAGTGGGGGAPTKPVGGGGGTTAPGNPTQPTQGPTDPAPPVEPTEDPTVPPVDNPTEPAPTEDPTVPAPTEDPTDTPPDVPPDNPPDTPPAEDPPVDSPPAEDTPPVDTPAEPPADPAPADSAPADTDSTTPAPTSTP